MTIIQEVNYYCDICGYHDRFSDLSVTAVIKILRKHGWSVGKLMKCPDCK